MEIEDNNPYSPPTNKIPAPSDQLAESWRLGDTVLVHAFGHLPCRCVRCGKATETETVMAHVCPPPQKIPIHRIAGLASIAALLAGGFLLLSNGITQTMISPLAFSIFLLMIIGLSSLIRAPWFNRSRKTVTYHMCPLHNNVRRIQTLCDLFPHALPCLLFLPLVLPDESWKITTTATIAIIFGLWALQTALHKLSKQLHLSVQPDGLIHIVGCDERFLSGLPEFKIAESECRP